MGKSKSKNRSEVEYLRGQVRELQAEVRRLRKKEHLAAEIDNLIEENIVEEIEAKRCKVCKHGLLLELEFSHATYGICDSCNSREKLSGKKKK